MDIMAFIQHVRRDVEEEMSIVRRSHMSAERRRSVCAIPIQRTSGRMRASDGCTFSSTCLMLMLFGWLWLLFLLLLLLLLFCRCGTSREVGMINFVRSICA